MKKVFLLIIFSALGYLGYLFVTTGPEYEEEELVIAETYVPEEEVPIYQFSDDEDTVEEKRPRGLKVEKREVEENFERRERTFIGPDFQPINNVPNNIKFENEVNPNWEKELIKEFLDEEEEAEANLEVQKLESLVFLKGEMGMYVEKVKIVVTEPKDMAGSFFAYVDSSSGEIFHAWEGDESPQNGLFGDMDEEDFDDGQFTETFDEEFEEGIEYTEEDMYEMGPEEIGYAPGYEEEYEEYN
jgi:hypothetical protein